VDVAGVKQPAPAPRFSRTGVEISRPPAHPGQHTREVLDDYGLAAADIDKLVETGAVKQA
jgi:alpha-methylacyl-CoA racemase